MNRRNSQEAEREMLFFFVKNWNFLFFCPFVKFALDYRFSVQEKSGDGSQE